MARYTGPRSRIARKFKEPIFGPDKVLEKKNYPPGQHGFGKKRGSKHSEYSEQLQEKQKAKYTYGILERQFRKTFAKASRSKGVTGEVLLQLVESRLDNVVYRLGFSSSLAQARQLVLHGHIEVNGRVVTIPSYLLEVGQVVSINEKSRQKKVIVEAIELAQRRGVPSWMALEREQFRGSLRSLPARADLTMPISEKLIVEHYSR